MIKPTLFNTEMVRAIQDGTKTVTRRVMKPQPRAIYYDGKVYDDDGLYVVAENQNGGVEQIELPYRPGDILYVRETWAAWSRTMGTPPALYYKADGNAPDGIKWHPSIHMPREAARIFLRVTGVRVERLWEITEEQARAEGLYRGWKATETSTMATTAKQAFMWVWDSTIKPADRTLYGWMFNPWVWVIEFERCEKPEESA